MAFWYLCSLVWSSYAWLTLNARPPFVAIAATGMFAAAQILLQDRLLTWVQRWQLPAWLGFGVLAGVVTVFGLALHLATLVLEGQGLTWSFSEWLAGRMPYTALFLLGWYRGWWYVLRRGWIDVPSSLIGAGVHSAAVIGLMDFVCAWGGWWAWSWFTPSNFFIGWSLMFVPGALAAHECPPPPLAGGSYALRALAWIAPALSGIMPPVLFAGAVFVLHG